MRRATRALLATSALLLAAPPVTAGALVVTGKRVTDVTVEFTVSRGENFGYTDFTLSGPFQGANPRPADNSGANCYMTSGQAGSCSITPGVHFFRLDIDVGPKPYCGQATSITVGPEFGGGGGGVESGSTTMPG